MMPGVTKPREHLARALEADLVGPFCLDAEEGQEEVLGLPPSRWYLTGFLAPESGRDPEDPESNEELAAGPDEDEEETQGAEPDTKRKNMLPASIGVSVLLPKDSGSDLTATVYRCPDLPGGLAEIQLVSHLKGEPFKFEGRIVDFKIVSD